MRQKGEVVYIIPKASFKRRARLPTLYLVVFLKQARDINSATPSLHAEGHPSRVSAPPPLLELNITPSGLPGQTMEQWEHTLSEAISTGAAHISVYDLQVREESRNRNRRSHDCTISAPYRPRHPVKGSASISTALRSSILAVAPRRHLAPWR